MSNFGQQLGGVHDVGGLNSQEKIDKTEESCLQWEKQTHALLVCLARKGLTTTDEHRRAVEALPGYNEMAYYHRWACALINICIERGTITKDELDKQLGEVLAPQTNPSFKIGEEVVIKREDSKIRWRKPHLRTPGYIFGSQGKIVRFLGCFPDPEAKAFFRDSITLQPLYLVQFSINELWKDYPVFEDSGDAVTVEIYEPWLSLQVPGTTQTQQVENVSRHFTKGKREDHGDHVHDDRRDTEMEALRREEALENDSRGETLSNALRNILVENKFLALNDIHRCIESMDKKGEMNLGQKIVARAWMDHEFKKRLLEDANAATQELDIESSNPNAQTKLIVVENTAKEHHVIVCTLCSCYPSAILGISPAWYRSRTYRARTVREPRVVLAEFGLTISKDVKIIVHDSTADCRYLVLPRRPAGTQDMNEQQLQKIVSRDSMLGVSVPLMN